MENHRKELVENGACRVKVKIAIRLIQGTSYRIITQNGRRFLETGQFSASNNNCRKEHLALRRSHRQRKVPDRYGYSPLRRKTGLLPISRNMNIQKLTISTTDPSQIQHSQITYTPQYSLTAVSSDYEVVSNLAWPSVLSEERSSFSSN